MSCVTSRNIILDMYPPYSHYLLPPLIDKLSLLILYHVLTNVSIKINPTQKMAVVPPLLRKNRAYRVVISPLSSRQAKYLKKFMSIRHIKPDMADI